MTNDTTQAQRDVEQARAQIGETVEELKRKLSPGELFDQVKAQLMSGGGSQRLSHTASRFSQQVQENPLALMLIGGGLAWLMMGSRGHDGHSTGDGSGMLSSARERVSSGMHGLSSGAHGVASSAHSVTGRTSHMVEAGTEHAGETVRHVRETSSEMIERYPLAAGAAAVALGVILGAALPPTSVEDRQIGETADKFKETATERGQEALSEARDVAAKAGEAAAREAEKEAEKRGIVQPEGGDGASPSPGHTGRG